MLLPPPPPNSGLQGLSSRQSTRNSPTDRLRKPHRRFPPRQKCATPTTSAAGYTSGCGTAPPCLRFSERGWRPVDSPATRLSSGCFLRRTGRASKISKPRSANPERRLGQRRRRREQWHRPMRTPNRGRVTIAVPLRQIGARARPPDTAQKPVSRRCGRSTRRPAAKPGRKKRSRKMPSRSRRVRRRSAKREKISCVSVRTAVQRVRHQFLSRRKSRRQYHIIRQCSTPVYYQECVMCVYLSTFYIL